MRSFKYIILILILFPITQAQALEGDDELWVGFEVKYDITDDLMFEFGQQARYKEDYSVFKMSLTDFGLHYRFTDNFKAFAFYRLRSRDEKPQHAAILALYAEEKWKPITIQYRLRFQNTFDLEDDNEYLIRNKLKVEADIKKLPFIPFTAAEIFYRHGYDKGDRFNRYRLYAGVEFDLPNKQKIDLLFIYQEEFNMKKPDLRRIIGLYYSVKL